MKWKVIVLFLLLSASLCFGEPYWYKSQLNTGVTGNCGPASVAMLTYLATNHDVSVQAVRSMIGLTRPDGATDMDELEKAMQRLHVPYLDIDWNRVRADELDPIVRMGYKIMVLVDLDQIDSKENRGRGLGGHYFIISGVDGDNYVVQDPFNGSDIKFNRKVVTRAMTTTRMIFVMQPFTWGLK